MASLIHAIRRLTQDGTNSNSMVPIGQITNSIFTHRSEGAATIAGMTGYQPQNETGDGDRTPRANQFPYTDNSSSAPAAEYTAAMLVDRRPINRSALLRLLYVQLIQAPEGGVYSQQTLGTENAYVTMFSSNSIIEHNLRVNLIRILYDLLAELEGPMRNEIIQNANQDN